MEKKPSSFSKLNSLVDVVSPILILGRLSGISPFDFKIITGKSEAVMIYGYSFLPVFSFIAVMCSLFIIIGADMKYMEADYPAVYVYNEYIQVLFG